MIKENEQGEVVVLKEMFFGMVGELERQRKVSLEDKNLNKLLLNENERLIKLIDTLANNK